MLKRKFWFIMFWGFIGFLFCWLAIELINENNKHEKLVDIDNEQIFFFEEPKINQSDRIDFLSYENPGKEEFEIPEFIELISFWKDVKKVGSIKMIKSLENIKFEGDLKSSEEVIFNYYELNFYKYFKKGGD